MSFVFYAVLMVVSLSSVVFGLEWLSEAPPVWKPVQVASIKQPASPEAKQPVQAVAVVKPSAPVAPPADGSASKAGGDADATDVRQTSTSSADDTATLARAPSASDIMVPEPGSESTAADAPRCDVQACTSAYRSFRVSDCTWQPYDGPRRFCDKGTPPGSDTVQAAEQATKPDETAAADQQVSNKCDIDACKRAYFTFSPADCTYQPSDGPRRLCTKGTPPRPDNAQAPVQETDTAQGAETDEPASTANASAAPEPAAQAPLCDVQACAAAYFTFNPADCTYRPIDGPRRLCTKGTPPRPDSAQAPGSEPEPDESEATSSVGAAPQARGPSCNVQACAAAYFTFDPTDCTYQPLNGPRRLCTK